jgi:hypothetical protein
MINVNTLPSWFFKNSVHFNFYSRYGDTLSWIAPTRFYVNIGRLPSCILVQTAVRLFVPRWNSWFCGIAQSNDSQTMSDRSLVNSFFYWRGQGKIDARARWLRNTGVVGIVTNYGLDDQGDRSSSPGGGKTGSGVHLASYPMGTAEFFAGVNRPGHKADQSSPASAEVKKMWIYTSTPPYAFMG